MAAKNVVVLSINLDGETRCVDVFRRPNGSFGFEEYRRDAEDSRGWFAIGQHSAQTFASEEDALAAARRAVTWLVARSGEAFIGEADL